MLLSIADPLLYVHRNSFLQLIYFFFTINNKKFA